MPKRWVVPLALALLLSLCACAPLLSTPPHRPLAATQSPETSASEALQEPSGEADALRIEVERTPAAAPPLDTAATISTETCCPVDEAHFLVRQQSAEVQEVFWTIYHGVQRFETCVTLPEGTTRAQVKTAGELLSVDCPELFQFSYLSAVYYMENAFDQITQVEISYLMDENQTARAQAALDAMVTPWLAQASGLSDYEKELFVHDHLIERCAYDAQAEHSGSVYGAMMLGRARCQGYANAMTYVLRKMGLECAYLYGQATNDAGTESHAWNLVRVGGVWTLVDVTWDDPVGDGADTLSHAYFNLTDEMMGESHVLDPFYADCNLPDCTSLSVNYCAMRGAFICEDQPDAVRMLLADALAEKRSSLCIQFSTRAQLEAVCGELQGILQTASQQAGVYPSHIAYAADPSAHYLEIKSIAYEEE